MKILFVCLSTLKFDADTPYNAPLGGTESAICYLSVELAKLGHNVTLMANTEPKLLRGVTHVAIQEDLTVFDPDVVIVTSAPQAISTIQTIVPRAKVVLWNHMMPNQPAMQSLFAPGMTDVIKHIVYVSERQRAHFTTLAARADTDGVIIGNAIAPSFENMFSSAEEILETKKCKGAYTSTPFRGLSVLEKIQELEIYIFSSMKVYQGDDAPFATMYGNLKKNDCLHFEGSLSQAKLADSLRSLSFLVYPCIFPECHSIAILEAMAAGLKVITTEAASAMTGFADALPSDCSVEDYVKLLRKNINSFRAHPEEWTARMWQQVQHINKNFTWHKRAAEWDKYLHSITGGLTATEIEPTS